MRRWWEKVWYQPHHPIAILLLPFSYLYRLIINLRSFLYSKRLLKTVTAKVPVIVVGNITVGGTGKTPMVIWLAEWLKQQGYTPGIVSRGYGAKTKNFSQWVYPDSNALQVGDEPLLIAQRTQCPVVIAPKRIQAIATLLANSQCNIIISDDGLQHYAMSRSIELVMVDAEREFGNGWCLPAGPLREPLSRLKTVDFIVMQGHGGFAQYTMQLEATKFFNLKNSNKIFELANIRQPIHAVAAIGNPQKFFNNLRQLGLIIIEHSFSDHYFFKPGELNFQGIVIMTEKDAVKYRPYADERHWFLRVDAQINSELQKDIRNKLMNHE